MTSKGCNSVLKPSGIQVSPPDGSMRGSRKGVEESRKAQDKGWGPLLNL